MSNRSGSNNIWVIPALGGTARQVTFYSGGTVATWPNWSPAEDVVCFQTNADGNVEIFAVDITDGVPGTPYQITNTPDDKEYPEWSHDGSMIAFSQKPGANRDIYYVTVSGGAITQVTNDALPDFAPTFSPDGNWIAYHTIFDGHYQIYRVATGGGTPEQLVYDRRDEEHPCWDRTGNTIAIMKGNAQNWRDIHLLDVATKVVTPVTDEGDTVHNSFPSFSPDGSRVAYTYFTAGVGDIYTIATQ